MQNELDNIKQHVNALESEVGELSKELIREQKRSQKVSSQLQYFAVSVVNLLEVEEDKRTDLSLDSILGILAAKLENPDPTDNVDISEE